MTVVALVSGKSGAVTVSALALALAAPRRSVLAELDPSGGTVRPGFQQGYGSTAAIGLHRLATAERSGTLGHDFVRHLVPLHGGDMSRRLLPGLTDPSQASAMAGVWDQLVRAWPVLEGDAADIVVDAGRAVVDSGGLSAARSPAAVLRRADVVLLVVRQTLAHVVASAPVAALLARDLQQHGTGADALGLLLVGEEKAPPASE
ncbi:hypothetical protein [Streptacidiphilus rugosus]|uniref:hypothetical protein n=1 Tax=Streptacidiphilus rugosus TaxID=405783 RepID=UPI000691F795|nr:hypothetical protein [Streptacidiphilus rugosus]